MTRSGPSRGTRHLGAGDHPMRQFSRSTLAGLALPSRPARRTSRSAHTFGSHWTRAARSWRRSQAHDVLGYAHRGGGGLRVRRRSVHRLWRRLVRWNGVIAGAKSSGPRLGVDRERGGTRVSCECRHADARALCASRRPERGQTSSRSVARREKSSVSASPARRVFAMTLRRPHGRRRGSRVRGGPAAR